MAATEYEVLEDVRFETHSPGRGQESFAFAKGRVASPSEDERFVLEYHLIPDGLASRVQPVSPDPKTKRSNA